MKSRQGSCKDCGQQAISPARLSKRGLCYACATERQARAIREMAAGEGPTADRWRTNLAEAIGGGKPKS